MIPGGNPGGYYGPGPANQPVPQHQVENQQQQPSFFYAPPIPSIPLPTPTPFDFNLVNTGSSSVLGSFGRSLSLGRTGEGGTGGGSMDTEGNMDSNLLIGLNPYLAENVTSFNQGGIMPINMRDVQSIRQDNVGLGGVSMDTSSNINPSLPMQQNPYLENNVTSFSHGGKHKTPKYKYGGVTHTMPDGTVHPGATHEEYLDMMNKYKHGGKHRESMYQQGGQTPIGQYERQANQMIALNQLSNIFRGLQQGSSLAPPIANKGMKMRKRYTQGGRF
jgi:hypothetical protein